MKMFVRALTVLCILAIWGTCSNAEEAVLLRWKLPLEEPVAFYTAMNPVSEEDQVLMSFNSSAFFDDDSIDTENLDEALSFKLPDEYSMTSVLTPTEDGNISVKLIMGNMPELDTGDDEEGEGINELLKAMQGTVQLRGEIDPAGTITSFYLESKQKNLLSMFFELPSEPVEVGDSWSIDTNLVTMGHGFICDSAEKNNIVTLTDLEEREDGETVATIKYAIFESVEGTFVMPLSMMKGMKNLPEGMEAVDKEIPSIMEFTFIGEGKFLVEEGVWEIFSGRMGIYSTGIMDSQSEQEFVLSPMDEVPEEFLNMK